VYLETLAQIAIGLTGFTGVIVGFAAQPERWTAMDRARLSLMLDSSIGALLLALLPMALTVLAVPDDLVWRLSSAALLLGSLGVIASFVRQLRQVASRDRGEFLPAVYLPLSLGTLVCLAAQAANVAGRVAPTEGVYVAGLAWSLVPAVVMFGRMVHVLMVEGRR
jgi:hypothetical protein